MGGCRSVERTPSWVGSYFAWTWESIQAPAVPKELLSNQGQVYASVRAPCDWIGEVLVGDVAGRTGGAAAAAATRPHSASDSRG